MLIRRKEKSEANILLNKVINLVDDDYKLFKSDIYIDITELLISIEEYKKAQICFDKASKIIGDLDYSYYENRLEQIKIKLEKILKNQDEIEMMN